jgi:hypothetical protein
LTGLARTTFELPQSGDTFKRILAFAKKNCELAIYFLSAISMKSGVFRPNCLRHLAQREAKGKDVEGSMVAFAQPLTTRKR